MGIKSLTVVLDDEGQETCVFQNLDGDLTGHGEYLIRILRGYVINREFRTGKYRKMAVSMGHLAVLFIKKFNRGIGFVELKPCGTREVGEEFIYTVYPRNTSPNSQSMLNLRVETYFPHQSESDLPAKPTSTVLYDGLLDEFDPYQVQSQWECREEEINRFVDRQIEMASSAKTC